VRSVTLPEGPSHGMGAELPCGFPLCPGPHTDESRWYCESRKHKKKPKQVIVWPTFCLLISCSLTMEQAFLL